MNKLNVGVVGTGHLGKLHIKMFRENENCNLIGINDSNTEQAKLAADKFSVKVFDSLESLLENVSAISIAATTSAHYKLAKERSKATTIV